MEQNTNPFVNNKLYKLCTWQNKLHSALAVLLINVFFYFYIVRGNSFINLASRVILLCLIYNFVRPRGKKGKDGNEKEQDNELISEEGLKQLYVLVYVGLNKAVQYVRSIIQMKDRKKSLFVSFYLTLYTFYFTESCFIYVHVTYR
jgi:hypothetical protein